MDSSGLQAHSEPQVFSADLQHPQVSSGPLVLRILLDPGRGLIHPLALQPSPGKDQWRQPFQAQDTQLKYIIRC